jgi:endogenous inhibitor of DNA gyrase (YacG/DUF329 family)
MQLQRNKMTSQENKSYTKTNNCRICKKALTGDDSLLFCSKRCKDIDLGNWALERYFIPDESVSIQEEQFADDLIDEEKA